MAINEEIVTGRKFRKCIDVANKLWQRISFWTMACDVWFNDGKNAEEKLGNVDKVVNELKNKITSLENITTSLENIITSFENTKSTIVSSALGRALGMAASNTWAQIVSKISSVANRGTLNWSGSNTTYAVPAGYYSGGTLDSRPSYNAGYAKGKADEAASHGGSRSGSFRVTVSSSNNTVDKTITFNPSFSNTPRCRVESTEFLGAEIIEITKLYMVIRCKYATQSSIGGDVVNGTVTWWAFAE